MEDKYKKVTGLPKKKSYSSEDLELARRWGYKPAKPVWQREDSQPKKVTETNVRNFLKRYNEWVDAVKKAATQYRASRKKSGGKTVKQQLKDALKG